MRLLRRAVAVYLLLGIGLLATSKKAEDEKATSKKAEDEKAAEKQMRVCFQLASYRAKKKANVVKKIMDAAIEAAEEGMSSEMALNTLLLGWMTKCYENIETVDADFKAAEETHNVTFFNEMEEKLHGPLPENPKEVGTDVVMEAMAYVMTQPKKLLRLAKKIMKEPAKKAAAAKEAAADRSSSRTELKTPDPTPQDSSKFGIGIKLALLAVLGLCGAGLAALRKLSKGGSSTPGKAKERKAEKKAGKRKAT